jgi:hypothetical protein
MKFQAIRHTHTKTEWLFQFIYYPSSLKYLTVLISFHMRWKQLTYNQSSLDAECYQN